MKDTSAVPMVVPAGTGRKALVLGIDITIKLSGQETEGSYFVFDAVVPPGVGVPPHVHQREDEIVQVVEGEVEIFLDGKTYQVTPDAVINFPKLVPHGFRNASTKPCRVVFTIVPGHNFEKFFVELGSLPSEGPPDMAKVSEIFRRYDMEILEQ